jgi:predicted alpha/beta hydrolase family esterase
MNKLNIFIIHGSFGTPNENWFPWLKKEISKQGVEVFIPQFPTPENQSLEKWLFSFKEYEDKLNDQTIFVGHSLGPAFILNLLQRISIKISSCYLVAPFVQLLNDPEFDTVNETFVTCKFDWENIKQHCKDFYVYYSDNDPYVPQEASLFVADKLNAKTTVLHNAGHINRSSGFEEFPFLLNEILNEIKSQVH